MFDRFKRHRFRSWKLLKLIADMVLHGWLKLWTRLPEWFLNFEELKFEKFTRFYTDFNLKNPSFVEKVARKLLKKKTFSIVDYPKMNAEP